MEAMPALLVAKRSARDARVRSLNQIRHLSFTAPDDLRARLRPLRTHQLAAATARLRPSGDVARPPPSSRCGHWVAACWTSIASEPVHPHAVRQVR